MNNVAIRVNNLSKCYHIYDRPEDRLKQLVVPEFRSLIGSNAGNYFREFWALNDVSFEVGRGETVGIIGRNGSGKSTLLQMICGTLEPTTGSVETNGRVAALLELGAGFNPEFTGRENVFMNATVLGLTENEIQSRFEDIAAFADIGDFIEQPVKHYSSGMYARLAFAVAINVDPSILIVDEALAVGDEPFQRKCFARIEEIKRNGGTILFVSHSSSAIISLCDRAILLHGGRRLYTGLPKIAIGWYQKLMNSAENNEITLEILNLELNTEDQNKIPASNDTEDVAEECENKTIEEFSGKFLADSPDEPSFDPALVSKSMILYETNGAEISNQRIETLNGDFVNQLVQGQRYRISFEVKFDVVVENVRFFSIIKTIHGVELGGGTYPSVLSANIRIEKDRTIQVYLDFDCNLRPDVYFLNCGVSNNNKLLHRILDALAFRVTSNKDSSAIGVVDFGCSSTINFKAFSSISEIS